MNLYARIARLFVDNRQLSLLMVLTIFVFGLFAFIATPKQYNPKISLPAFRITTEAPGLTAAEVETLVSSEMENRISELPGIDETSSVSLPGKSIVTVLFEIGEDEEVAKTKVEEKLASNRDLAPLGVGMPIIKQINPENVPAMTLALTSDTYTPEGLRAFAYDLREQLKTVGGVTQIDITGGRPRQLLVTLDPARMTARSISIDAVTSIIQAHNIRTPVGVIEGATQYLPVEVAGTLTSAAQLSQLTVGGTADSPIYLGDIAEITDGYATIANVVRFTQRGDTPTDDTNAVYLSLAKRKGENGVTITENIHIRLASLQESFVPDGITLTVVRDDGATAREAINGLTGNLMQSIGIVFLVLLVFLRARAAITVALAIPLTLALVLLAGYIAGETINRITLFALILSLGLLVDSATVVVENIYRHLAKREQTETRTDAVANAVGEVGTGLLLSTVTSVIVFLPMYFVTGMMGAYMGPIAFFVPVALIASQFIAYTLTPYLASRFLKTENARDEQKTTRLDVWYRHLIERILASRRTQNSIIISVLIGVLVTFSFPVVELIHFRMLPKADKEQFFLYLDAPESTPRDTTNLLAQRAEARLHGNTAVTSVQTFVATPSVLDFNGLFKGADTRTGAHQATLKVNLTHPDERAEASADIVARLRPEITALFADEPDLQVQLVEDPPGPPVLATLHARVSGPDPVTREAIARDVLALYRTTPGVVDIASSLPTGSPQTTVSIDHAKLSHSGLTTQDVVTALSTAIDGKDVATAHLSTRERTYIHLRYAAAERNDTADLGQIFLKNTASRMVPLTSVTTITTTASEAAIQHDDRAPVVHVTGELAGRAVVYAVKDLIFQLLDYPAQQPACREGNLSSAICHLQLEEWSLFGFTYRDTLTGETYTVRWGGEFEMTLENFRDLGLAMLVAFFLVYVVLVAQFRSFVIPLLVMSSIFLAFGGVMPGFAILDRFGIYFTATSMIGIIALGGIVVNNAIILLEFIQQLRERGLTVRGAIAEATQTRLRPILLTSLTTILGSLTIAGDPVWSGLAWAIVFGLSLSTVLTLIVFPVLYYRVVGEEAA